MSSFQEKALEKLSHSKKVFKNKRRTELEKIGVQEEVDDLEGNYNGASVHDSFVQACERGDWRFVAQCLESSKDNGKTLLERNPHALHESCWNARLRVSKLLLKYSGQELINRKDLSGTTPLIALCRSRNGPVKLRIVLLRCLLDHGADVQLQDKGGDTCLHWLARNSDGMLTKTLFSNSRKAVLLTSMLNKRGRTPLDVACIKGTESYVQFLQQRTGGTLFQKRIIEMEMDEESRREQAREHELDILAENMELAQDLLDQANRLSEEQHLSAELERKKLEKAAVDREVRRATEQAEKWLQGKYGANELKTLTKTIKKELIERQAMGQDMSMVKDIGREAKVRAMEMLIKKKQKEARAKALSDFRAKNPPL